MRKIIIDSVTEYANKIKDCTQKIKASYDELTSLENYQFDQQDRAINEPSNYDEAASILGDAVNSLEYMLARLPRNVDLINIFCTIPSHFSSLHRQQNNSDIETIARIDNPASQDFTIKNQIYSMARSQVIAKKQGKDSLTASLCQEILYKTSQENYFIVTSSIDGLTAKPVCIKDAMEFWDNANQKIESSETFKVYA